MWRWLEDIGDFSHEKLIIGAIILIFISGFGFGLIYYLASLLQTALTGITCTLPVGAYNFFSSCQGALSFSVYKVLNLKSLIVWASYLFIFTLVIAVIMLSFRKGKSAVRIGILFLTSILFTYGAIPISNIYRRMITDSVMYSMVQPLTIYNFIMLNFPWFVGFLTIIGLTISIINFQRSPVNTSTTDLNY